MLRIIHLLLFLFSLSLSASTIDTLTVYSASMHKKIKNVIILPETYSTSTKKFPVLYLLHGANGNYKTWVTSFPQIKKIADDYNIVLICPDGGTTSWYLDSPFDKKYQYETYLAKELFPYVEKNYKILKNRESHAIMGFSMGGHGAISLVLKHPNLWSIAISSSGGVDLRPFPTRWDIAKRIGSIEKYPQNWEQNSVVNMLSLYKKEQPIQLFIDCGTNDFFYQINKDFHKKLLSQNIPHVYMERLGAHTQEYWAGSLPYQLTFLKNYLKNIPTSDRNNDKCKHH